MLLHSSRIISYVAGDEMKYISGTQLSCLFQNNIGVTMQLTLFTPNPVSVNNAKGGSELRVPGLTTGLYVASDGIKGYYTPVTNEVLLRLQYQHGYETVLRCIQSLQKTMSRIQEDLTHDSTLNPHVVG